MFPQGWVTPTPVIAAPSHLCRLSASPPASPGGRETVSVLAVPTVAIHNRLGIIMEK